MYQSFPNNFTKKQPQRRCGATMQPPPVRRDAFPRLALTCQRSCKRFLHDVSMKALSLVRPVTGKASFDSRNIAGAISNIRLLRKLEAVLDYRNIEPCSVKPHAKLVSKTNLQHFNLLQCQVKRILASSTSRYLLVMC
jgi:hypothetical protein